MHYVDALACAIIFDCQIMLLLQVFFEPFLLETLLFEHVLLQMRTALRLGSSLNVLSHFVKVLTRGTMSVDELLE